MPTLEHEMPIELFRNRPDLAAALLKEPLGVDVPVYAEARIECADFTDVKPTEYRADMVITFRESTDPQAQPKLAVIVEVQRREDRQKRLTWPVYLATVRHRMDCPVMLLVLCPNDKVARWCTGEIAMGPPGWNLRPFALGPGGIPVVTDPELASRLPELGVLSALGHSEGPLAEQVLKSLVDGVASLDEETATLYLDYVFAKLSKAGKKQLGGLMASGSYKYQGDFATTVFEDGRSEGHAEGHADSVLKVLDVRGVVVSEGIRQRIADCRDEAQLDIWLDRAVKVASAEELFREELQ
ncbi:hypothetical protein [Rhizohabitans arisaemae]|uniref:hypothetical protein n=1 Tax=Rhizohabitans arisaemae TaxID=2720610 RepID=UPI0024B1FBA8|nr:hypothetical protein [Rhizohabitans arisaemae]